MTAPLLYAFVGTVTAAEFELRKTKQAYDPAALAAMERLKAVSRSLLEAAASDAGNDLFKEAFKSHAADVVEAVQALRAGAASHAIHAPLNATLEYFYNVAEAILTGKNAYVLDIWQCSFGSASSHE
jgi:hypothetical protein